MHFPVEYCALVCKSIDCWINYVAGSHSKYFDSLWEMQPLVKNGSDKKKKTSNLHRLVRSHKEESIYYNFWWWCNSSEKRDISVHLGCVLWEAHRADVQAKLLIGLSNIHGCHVHHGQPGRSLSPVLNHSLAPCSVRCLREKKAG